MSWWGPVLVAFCTSTATIGAVYLAQLFTSRREENRWLSDHQLRWDATRHEAYAEFAAAIKQELRLHVMFAEHRWPGTWLHHAVLDYAENVATLDDAESARVYAFEGMNLLANRATVSAARRWQTSVWSLRQALHAEFDGGGQGFMHLFDETGYARDAFYAAAREDLGAPGPLEDVPPTPHGGPLGSAVQL